MAGDLSEKRKDPVFLDIDNDHRHYNDHFYYPIKFGDVENKDEVGDGEDDNGDEILGEDFLLCLVCDL